MWRGKLPAIWSALALTLGAVWPSSAFDIDVIPGTALAGNTAALNAFDRAAAQWGSLFLDPITVTINVDLAPLGSGVLGQTSPVSLTAGYSTVRSSLIADAAGSSTASVES